MSKIRSDKLILLEKLMQSSSDGEITNEQRDLFVNLLKETSPKSPKMKNKGANMSDRPSRQRKKIIRDNSHEIKDKSHGNVTIPMPEENGKRSRSRSHSSKSRSDSSSSFWSSGSQDRARIRKTSSRSRSSSRSKSYSRSRSRSNSQSSSSSRSSSRSRSRSPSMEYSRNRQRQRSKSPTIPKSPVKIEPRSGSLSSTQSAPPQQRSVRRIKTSVDTASDSGHKGKRKKLFKRGEMRKYRSFDINPDLFIEEKIKRKYKELHNLLNANQFSGSQTQLTNQHYQQMQNLRSQYVSASHGLPPTGILVPRSLPAELRVKRGAPRGLTNMKSRSRDTLTSELGEDTTYVSVQRVMNTSAAREGRVVVDPHPVMIKKKKKTKKNDSEKLNSSLDSTSEHTGSRTLSPRSKTQEIHHLKECDNQDLLKWLKQKDKEHRKKEREERKKKREEREKLVLEVNDKFERRLESQKVVKKWMSEKEKDYRKYVKAKRQQEKEFEVQQKVKMELSFPGRSMTVRAQTAPTDWKSKSDTNLAKNRKDKLKKESKDERDGNVGKALTVQDQLGTSSEHLKFDLNEHKDPLPPTSKFMYKRPVAGKIKLNMRNRPMSAQPKLQTTVNKENVEGGDTARDRNARMSYDDWVNTKRKQDQEKRKQEKIRQKEDLSKSDPAIANIVPDIAKKRIHTIMNERKSIDTGIKRYDAATNRSFGGGSFDGNKSPTREHSYKLSDDRPATATDKRVESLKVAGKTYHRPGTAPAGGKRIPVPPRSPYSPVPAAAPARVEQVMNSEDDTNPFKMPFPDDQGAPKHVAAMQKKLFSDKNWKQDDPENLSMDVVPYNNTDVTEDIKYDNITAIDQSKNVKNEEKIDTQYLNGDSESGVKKEDANIQKEGEQTDRHSLESSEDESLSEEIPVNIDKSSDEEENEKNEEEDLSNENISLEQVSDKNMENNVETMKQSDDNINGYDEVDSGQVENKTGDEKEDNPLSHSSKKVSFCEKPEVFVEQEVPEWSTDTGTPDEDNSRYTTREDLSKLIDSCGELLNREYDLENPNEEGDKAFITGSLDDDF